MTAFFNGCEPAVGWLLRVSGQASVLILLILLVQAIFGRRLASRWRYALWLLVVLRLLIPFSLTSSVSIFNLARLKPSAQPGTRVAETPANDGRIPRSNDPVVQAKSEASVSTPPAAAPAKPAPTSPVAQAGTQVSLLWWHVFALLWLVGAGILSLRILWENAVFYGRLRWEPTVTNAEAWEVLEECRQLMGVRYRLVLVETSLAHSPALYGFLRLHLLLPEKTLAAFSPEELRYVFLHELAHVKRRDMLVNWFVTLLQVAHWFNPLIWLAFRRMSADRELAADALALSYLEGQENHAYGQAIIKLLHNLLSPAALPGVVGILEDKNQMKRRMHMIAHFRSARHGSLLAALLFATLGLITLTDAQTHGSKSRPDKDEGRRQPVVKTLVSGGAETDGILSPDETMIAYVDWDRADGFTPLMIKELASEQRHVVAESELIKSTGDHSFAHPVVWSPEARWLAYGWRYGERGELKVGSVPNGPSRVLKAYDPEVSYSPEDWSRDGEWILCVLDKKDGTKALGMVSPANGQVRELASFGESSPAHARFSPDGKWVVYECAPGGNRDVYVIQVETKQIRRLTDWPTEEGRPVWSLDGNHILFSSNRRGVWDLLEIRMEQGRPVGEPRLLKYDLGAYPKRLTRTGDIAFNVNVSIRSLDVYSLEVNPTTGESMGQPVRLTKSLYGKYLRPAWSPDGKRIAYIRQGQWTLCIQTIATGEEESISTGMWPANQVFWSPDGNAVALTPSSKEGKIGVFYFSLSSRQLRPIALCPNFSPKGFTPDGKEFVLFKRGDKAENVAVDIETGKERKLMLPEGFNSWTYDFSRDQARIAYVESEPNAPEKNLVVSDRDFKDRHAIARAKGINQPRWSPDGTKIAFLCDSGNKSSELRMVAADGRWQTKVNTGHFKVASRPDWSPDSRKLALTLREGDAGVKEIALLENPFAAFGKGRQLP